MRKYDDYGDYRMRTYDSYNADAAGRGEETARDRVLVPVIKGVAALCLLLIFGLYLIENRRIRVFEGMSLFNVVIGGLIAFGVLVLLYGVLMLLLDNKNVLLRKVFYLLIFLYLLIGVLCRYYLFDVFSGPSEMQIDRYNVAESDGLVIFYIDDKNVTASRVTDGQMAVLKENPIIPEDVETLISKRERTMIFYVYPQTRIIADVSRAAGES